MLSKKRVIGISLALTLSFSAFMLLKALLFAPEREVRIKTAEKAPAQQAAEADKEEQPESAPPLIPAAEESRQEERININTADKAQLESLPGIGPSLADAIISHREEKGFFEKESEILDVSGIGEAKFKAISELISVGD